MWRLGEFPTTSRLKEAMTVGIESEVRPAQKNRIPHLRCSPHDVLDDPRNTYFPQSATSRGQEIGVFILHDSLRLAVTLARGRGVYKVELMPVLE